MRSDSGSQDAQSNGNICLHLYSHWKSWEKARSSLILLIWEKYTLIILHRGSCTTKKLYQHQYTGNNSTCQLLHASVNTLAGMGSIWMNANTTWQTVPLLYSCSLPHAPRHLPMLLSNPDGAYAPTLPLHLLAFSYSYLAPNWDVMLGRS